jgi:bacillithiol system protein YtxJ
MNEIATEKQLDSCLEASKDGPVFLFKHSTRCPISAAANSRVSSYEEKRGDGAPPVYVIKVVESRDISNEAAQRLEVQHKSPQLILVKNGEAVWSASHHSINEERMEEAAAEHGQAG